MGEKIRWAPALIAMALIQTYRIVLSPLLPRACRFNPSCSEFALEAIRKYGLIRGGWLAGRRILRCHPWNPGGIDPVP